MKQRISEILKIDFLRQIFKKTVIFVDSQTVDQTENPPKITKLKSLSVTP